jgi:hypothetical protein
MDEWCWATCWDVYFHRALWMKFIIAALWADDLPGFCSNHSASVATKDIIRNEYLVRMAAE